MRKTTEKHGLTKRVMAMLLVVMMVLTTAVSAFAVDGGALGGDITVGGGDALISEGVPNNNSDSGSLESILDNIPDDPDNEDSSPDEDEGTTAPPLNVDSGESQGNSADNSLQEYVNSIFAHYAQAATPFGLLRAPRASNALSFTAISWTGGDLMMGLGGSNPAHLAGSPGMPRMSLNGEVAFCVQWGRNPNNGDSYTPSGEGNDNRIKQILANYDNSAQGDEEYAAAQVAIWMYKMGLSTVDWGGCPGQSAWDEIAHGTCDYSDMKYNYINWDGPIQDIITYHTDDVPGDDDDDDFPWTPDDDDDSTPEDAFGQVTITKKDDEGRALDGAVFKIDIVFSNGSTGGQSRFEVKDGQRTYYYKHPKGDTGPAEVTVTEIQAPPNYVLDPTPQKVTVNPTYAKDGGGSGGTGGAGGSGGTGGAGGSGGGASLVIGDRPELTFVNADEECSLKIVKYQKGREDIVLPGAQFHIEYADPSVCSDRWDLVTDENGEINISLKKPGTLIVTETQAPENYKIIEKDNNRMIVIQRGEDAVMKVPNEKHGSLIIYKMSSFRPQKESIIFCNAYGFAYFKLASLR